MSIFQRIRAKFAVGTGQPYLLFCAYPPHAGMKVPDCRPSFFLSFLSGQTDTRYYMNMTQLQSTDADDFAKKVLQAIRCGPAQVRKRSSRGCFYHDRL